MRSFTLAVVGSKGGVGKTTIAITLAVHAVSAGHKVALLDMDAQGSLTLWWRMRGSPDNPLLVPLDSKPPKGVDVTLIDTPPSHLDVIERAIRQCDVAVIPVRAGAFDVAAVKAVIDMCQDAGRFFLLVLNADEPRRRELREQTLSALKNLGPTFSRSIENRAVYVSTIHRGLTGPEAADGPGKAKQTTRIDAELAAEEVAELWGAILTVLKHARKA